MNKLIKFIFTILITFFSFFTISNAEINLAVSPIKYEIKANTGQTIVKSAILFNRSDKTFTIHTGKSDFEAKDGSGNPKFIRKSDLINPSQELSSWISFETETFELGAKEEKEVFFTIQVPENATPGGHYGAVFFKNNNSEKSSGTQISINVDYGVLLLVNVEGEIIVDVDIKETHISGNGGYGWGNRKLIKDDCPLGDFTKSSYDEKCVDDFFTDLFNSPNRLKQKNLEENNLEEKNTNNENKEIGKKQEILNQKDNIKNIIDDEENFEIDFQIPFENKGNTHIKPEGKIRLIDIENGKQIKGIGKEVIKDENGMVIGEKIVDYIPINDVGGNVLPYTKRFFETNWKGFPYKTYDDEGNNIIKYWTPEEYYTKENINEQRLLMPWQRINERISNKTIKAITELSYQNENGENINFNSAKDFKVSYKEKYVGINSYVIVGGIFFIIFIFLFWLIFIKRKKHRCSKCNKKIDKNMKICPYCGKKQKKKKH